MHILQKSLGYCWIGLQNRKLLNFVSPCTTIVKHGTTWPTWDVPDGHDTGIKVYNTVSKSKVPLRTKKPGCLTWYMCGPTVYDASHIGHGLCYLRFDIIRRLLRDYFNLSVFQVMGITDIDDKIINKSQCLNVDFTVISRRYEKEFFSDMSQLGVQEPNLSMRVTDHVQDIIKFIEEIENAGLAYRTIDGSVFFNNIAYRNQRELSDPDDISLNTGHENSNLGVCLSNFDSISPHRHHPIDFALWKAVKLNEPSWESPFGPGRPGWHIECSVMASCLFGASLDVHSGGKDLVFPHHYCEEAQSCARHSTNIWTNYWWHAGHLTIDFEKMSKSIGNVISIKKLLKRHNADTFRQFALTTHYTNDVMYGDNTLTVAASQVRKIQGMLDSCYHFLRYHKNESSLGDNSSVDHPLIQELNITKENVDKHFRDDFNTSSAMKSIISLVSLTNTYLSNGMSSENSIASTITNHSTDGSNNSSSSENKISSQSVGPHEIFMVRDYILKTMQVLGMNYDTKENMTDISSSQSDSDNSMMLSDVMDTLLQFRQKVRQEALSTTHNQLADSNETEKEWRVNNKNNLLKYCDDLRNQLQSVSIVVKDQKEGLSWRVSKNLNSVTNEENKSSSKSSKK